MSSTANYTPEEDAIIRNHYPTMSTRKLWRQFLSHRSLRGIGLRAWKLGVRKEPEARDFKDEVTTMIGNLSESEKWYFAGIFDGEGCVHMRISETGVCRFYLTVTTTSPNLLAWIRAKMPGRCYIQTRERPGRKFAWIWVVPGNRRVICLCHELAPYLTVKRRQAELVAAGYIRLDHAGRLAMHDRLKAMKRTD